jgi:hypothetical protein
MKVADAAIALDIATADVGPFRMELEGERRFRFDQRHVLRRGGMNFNVDRERSHGRESEAKHDGSDERFHETEVGIGRLDC